MPGVPQVALCLVCPRFGYLSLLPFDEAGQLTHADGSLQAHLRRLAHTHTHGGEPHTASL